MVSKPAVIGYKGNMFSHQENTLEGIKAAADGKFQGVHMQVQATSDDKLIVFGDENLKRLTGVDTPIRQLKYEAIAGTNIKTEVKIGLNVTLRYSKSVKIPLLEDVLNAIKGKGQLIYIELVPSVAPPASPLERDHALRVGKGVAKLIRKLNMINEVFVVSSDPFKLLPVSHENSNIVTGWWFKKEFYKIPTIEKMRKEFVDLKGLRNCYIKTAPTGAQFAPFLYETGIVTKSVNGSLFDSSVDIINNAAYLSGRADTTIAILKKNYHPQMKYGAILKFYEEDQTRDKKTVKSQLQALLKKGMDRVITDDPQSVMTMLTAVGGSYHVVFPSFNVVFFSFSLVLLGQHLF